MNISRDGGRRQTIELEKLYEGKNWGGGRRGEGGRRYTVKTVETISDERDEPLWSWVCMLGPTA